LGIDRSHAVERYALTGQRVFWIASFSIILLLAIYIIMSTQVTQYNAADLGLLTKLPVTFWIGLSYLVMLLYVGRKSGLKTAIVAVLIFFYLFGIPMLVHENKAEFLGISYFYSYQGTKLFSSGHLDLNNVYMLNWFNWPGFFILAGFLSAATSLPVTFFADYFALVTIALLGILAYKTLRLQLNMLLSSFGALWFVASFWTRENYFSPQGVAYIIYFSLFLLLAKLFFAKKQKAELSIAVLFLFIGLVTTHLLTSFAVLSGVIAVYAAFKIFQRKRKTPAFYSIITCILLVCIFLAYQALVITQSFVGITDLLVSQFSRGETHLAVVSQGRPVSSPALQCVILGSYGITIVNVVIAAIAILATVLGILLYKRQEATNDSFWIAWIIVAGIIGVSVYYGGEVIQRAFILMLLPTCYFAAKFFSKKPRILIFILIAIVFLQIPAHYANMSYLYVPTTELKGTAFYARYAPPTAPFLYENSGASFPPSNLTGYQLSIEYIAGLYSIPSSKLINETIGRAEFIISSIEQKNSYQYFYGVNILENLSLDNYNNRLYDNGGFQVYGRLSG
jgi:hypothetical protein